MHSLERILPEAEADRGGHGRGRRPPRGPPSGWAWFCEVEEWCWIEGELRASIYSRPEAVAEDGISSVSNYGEVVVALAS